MHNDRFKDIFSRLSLWHILALALGLRLGFILLATGAPLNDAGYYFAAARDLAAGKGYLLEGRPTAYWPVGYPFFLSLVFRLFGPHLLAARIIQALASCGLAALAFVLVRRVHGTRAGRLAALILALMPSQIAFPYLLYGETIFAVLSLAGIILLAGDGGWKRAGAGLCFGAACYIRPEALFFPLLALTAQRGLSGRVRGVRLLVQFLIIGAATAPWAARNTRLFQRPVWLSTNLGINLWMGNHDGATGGYGVTPEMEAAMAAAPNEADFDRLARRRAGEFILGHPGRFLRLAAAKVYLLWGKDMDAARESFMRVNYQAVGRGVKGLMAVSQLSYLAAGLGALAAAVLLARRRRMDWLPVLMILYPTLLYALTTASPRYHFSGAVWLAVLAASIRGEP